MSAKPTVLPFDAPPWSIDLVREIQDITRRLQRLERFGGQLNTYTVATLPSVTGDENIIMVSDEAGGHIVAFSDGTDWRRVQDRAVVT